MLGADGAEGGRVLTDDPLVPVRLSDIHPNVLRAAARRLGRDEAPLDRLLLMMAATEPSDTDYWLPRSVVAVMMPHLAPSSRPDMVTGPASAGPRDTCRDPADRPQTPGE